MILAASRAAAWTFEAYGILVPVRASRSAKTLEALLSDPELRARRREWLFRAEPGEPEREDLLRVHDAAWVDKILGDEAAAAEAARTTYELVNPDGTPNRYDPGRAERPLGEIMHRGLANAWGTFQACGRALDSGFCFFLGGGMHHAMRETGRGFCPVNDIVVAVRSLQAEGRIRTAWILDVDAHKGDGTAALTLGDPTIRTLSAHMRDGWPLDDSPLDAGGNLKPAFWPSDVDVPVAAGGEASYVEALRHGLGLMRELFPLPDLAVVVDGADPYEKDELPSAAHLRLSLKQMLARDRLLYDFLEESKVPQAWLMAGGYGDASWGVYANFLSGVLRQRLAGV